MVEIEPNGIYKIEGKEVLLFTENSVRFITITMEGDFNQQAMLGGFPSPNVHRCFNLSTSAKGGWKHLIVGVIRLKVNMNFILQLQGEQRYIEDVVRYSGSGIFSVAGYTDQKENAFVFPDNLRNHETMKEVSRNHIVENIDKSSNV